MKTIAYIFLGIPSILITLYFGFIPWGLVAVIASAFGIPFLASLFPKRSYIIININTALEGLSYGRLNDAKDHILIAIREAESAAKITTANIEQLCKACDKISGVLEDAGHLEVAQDIRQRGSDLFARFTNINDKTASNKAPL